MATAQGNRTGWIIARIVSLLLAIGIAFFSWTTWKGDFERFWVGSESALPVLIDARDGCRAR